MAEKTYTEDEYNSLLAQVSDLQSKMSELVVASEESELDARVAAVKAELEAQLADVQGQLDIAVQEAEAAKASHDAIVAWLENEMTAAEEAAELAGRRDSRLAAVKEHASFPESYLEEHAERFVAMSDDSFEAALADWKAIGAKKEVASVVEETVPSVTALVASRSTDSKPGSVLGVVLDLRFQGVDPRTV